VRGAWTTPWTVGARFRPPPPMATLRPEFSSAFSVQPCIGFAQWRRLLPGGGRPSRGAPPASGDEGRRNAHGLAGLRTIPCRACLGLGKRPDWAKEEGPGLRPDPFPLLALTGLAVYGSLAVIVM